MNMIIRHEEPEDYYPVEQVTREAFWNLYRPGCNEHLIVHCLRKHPDFIPELSFVIEWDGTIAGSIFYSRSTVMDHYGSVYNTITFGPVSISPHLHRRGLGRALITHSISEAKTRGYNAIVIGGYPYHYAPYGFVGAKKYGISLPDGNYYTGIMALPLLDGALDKISGSIHFSKALEPDENTLEEFDKQFPQKEKQITKSQTEFENAVSKIDDRDFKHA